MPPQHPPGSEGNRRDSCSTRGQNRCPGAAAGPGRASRSTTPSHRLACGDLAGGPPPPGTWTIGSAAVTREALHPLGGNAPNQKGYNANRWGRAPIDNKYKCGLAARNNDLDSNASRTRAACSARGRGCPDSEQQAHVRMRRPHQGTQSTNPSNTTRPITPHVDLPDWKAPLGLRGPRGLRDPARLRDRLFRAAGSRHAYCRSDSSRFARTTMPIRSTIASSTQLPSSAAERGCTGASSKRRSKPRIAHHRGMSSSW